jgi:hypothetical protein
MKSEQKSKAASYTMVSTNYVCVPKSSVLGGGGSGWDYINVARNRMTYHPSGGTSICRPDIEVEGNIYYLISKVNNYELRPVIF